MSKIIGVVFLSYDLLLDLFPICEHPLWVASGHSNLNSLIFPCAWRIGGYAGIGGDTVHDKVTVNSTGTPLFCLDSFFQTHIELYFF